jgi:hypothetical protein
MRETWVDAETQGWIDLVDPAQPEFATGRVA